MTDAQSHTHTLTYDGRHNVLTATDPLTHTWTYTYGVVANVLTVQSPLTGGDAQTWTMNWEHPSGTAANFYRLTSATDPNGYVVGYQYYDPNMGGNPTHVIGVHEPAADPNNPACTTVIEYYDEPNAPAGSRGQVRLVTDANGVQYSNVYDARGHLRMLSEGLQSGGGRDFTNGMIIDVISNGLGWQVGNGPEDSSGPAPASIVCPDANGNVDPGCSVCWEWDWKKDRDGGHPLVRLGRAATELPVFPQMWEIADTLEYDVVGRPTTVARSYDRNGGENSLRKFIWTYDDLRRPVSRTLSFGMEYYPPWTVVRASTVDSYDPDGRPLQITGPDGQVTAYGYDQVGRSVSIIRAGTGSSVGVAYHYDDAGRLAQVDHTDGSNVKSTVVRHYDDADRLEWIKHFSLAADPNNPSLLLWIKYVWNTDNTVATRTEIDYTAVPATTAVVTFWYDGRKRLVSESRVMDGNTPVYGLTYTYDQLGNRKTKTDWLADRVTTYVYDTDPSARLDLWQDPNGAIQTRNNRLLRYYEYGPDGGGGRPLERTVWYTYYTTGDVSNITVKDEDPNGPSEPANDPNNPYNWYHDVALYYSFNHALQHAVWDRWRWDPNTLDFVPYSGHLLWRRDFQYDSPRELVRVEDYPPFGNGWDPNGLTEQRTDYLGEQPYQDYTTLATWDDPNVAWMVETTETKRYLGGFGTHAEQMVSGGETQFLHGDLIASTMMTTDAAGSVAVPPVSYTAFGEPVFDPNALATRYQYGGGWGYETGQPTNEPNVVPPNGLLGLRGTNPSLPAITLLHVGARWYDPSIGRFVQRDPIGLEGGILNMYAYCNGKPAARVDPSGLQFAEWPFPLIPDPDERPLKPGGLFGGVQISPPLWLGPTVSVGVEWPFGERPHLIVVFCFSANFVIGGVGGGAFMKMGDGGLEPDGWITEGGAGPFWGAAGEDGNGEPWVGGGLEGGGFWGGGWWE